MGWRDHAKEERGAEHTRHDRHKSPDPAASVPNVPNVPGAVAARRLKLWHGKLAGLDHFTSPPGWSLNYWLDTIDAAMWLYETFASHLVRDGFTAADLYGVLPAYPGEGGIADRLGNARNLKLLDGVAHWRTVHGLHKQFPRGGGADLAKGGLVLLWEIR